jgi:predicted RNA binding protein YcfA (HicA-like mRNA interferase family)
MPIKVQELLRILRENGWYLVRQKGSHRQFHHPTKTGTVTIAGKASVELPPATLQSVLKQAQLKR